MSNVSLRTASGACRSCGAYGNTDHRPTCKPGRTFALGRSRRAPKDARTSAAARANQTLQRELVRGL